MYTLTILGNTVHTALLGMFAYWGPKGATLIFRMLPGQADLVFGLVTVTTGILGTLSGGWVLDKLGGNAHAAGRVCFMAISAGFLLLQLGFIFTTTFGAFVSVFAVGQFALFMLQVGSDIQHVSCLQVEYSMQLEPCEILDLVESTLKRCSPVPNEQNFVHAGTHDENHSVISACALAAIGIQHTNHHDPCPW